VKSPTSRAILLMTAAGGFSSSGHAQTLGWNNPSGGSASSSANWNPTQVPTSNNPISFDINRTYAVTFDAASAHSASTSFTRGIIGLTMLAPHTTGAITFGQVAGQNPRVSLSQGTWNAGGITMGAVAGAAGQLTIAESTLNAASVDIGTVSSLGSAVTVRSGGVLVSSSGTLALSDSASVGSAFISGTEGGSPSRWSVNGTLTIAALGTGAVSVDHGALLQAAGDLIIASGQSPGPVLSQGSLTVTGTDGALAATVTVGDSLRVGRGRLDSSSAGSGTVDVSDGGEMIVTGSATFGGSGSGSGSLIVSQGASFSSTGLTFGDSGSLTHTGGTITVTNAPFVGPDPTRFTVSGDADTTFVLDNSDASFTSTNIASSGLVLGDIGSGSGTGTLRVGRGSTLSLPLGGITIGDAPGSTGTLEVTGGSVSHTTAGSSTSIAKAGTGSLLISEAGFMHIYNLSIAHNAATGHGLVSVDGRDSSLIISGGVNIAATNVGQGTLSLANGAFASCSGPFATQVNVGTTGTLNIDSATLDCTGLVRINGALSVFAGTLECSELVLNTPAPLSGTVRGEIRTESAGSITVTGPLSIGTSSTLGYQAVPLAVGPHAVTIVDANTADLAATSIAGGSLSAVNGLSIPGARTLSGTGTITGMLSNSGSIVASGTNGLTFNTGLIHITGASLSGTIVKFPSGSTFQVSGAASAKVQGSAGAQLNCFIASTLSRTETDAFVWNGNLDIAANLTFADADGLTLSGQTLMRAAGRITGPGTITHTGTLIGGGFVQAPFVNLGTITPGQESGDPSQRFIFTQHLNLSSPASNVVLEVDGTAPGEFDSLQLNSNGSILGGTLTVGFRPGYTPNNGDQWTLVFAPINTLGNFAVANTPPRTHLFVSGGNRVMKYCTADFNSDGFVDGFDYDDFVACFEGDSCPIGETADFNNDGFADGFDYDDFIAAFEEGC